MAETIYGAKVNPELEASRELFSGMKTALDIGCANEADNYASASFFT
jgi:hypothetical protein